MGRYDSPNKHTHARHGPLQQQWRLPYCKYYGSLKQNDTHGLMLLKLDIFIVVADHLW